ncbi:CRISP/Allergen/PR-1 [Nymphon striatum]|nr:CRISP/Allergen/PR-1 [Nymphon striatum]
MDYAKLLIIFSHILMSSYCYAEDIELEICDTCECYKRFEDDHSFCLTTNDTACGSVNAIGVTEQDKVKIINFHNSVRSKLATGDEHSGHDFRPAANMMQMEWDEHLAAVAQAHADQCTTEHDCDFCRHDPRFIVGQNMCEIPGRGELNWDVCLSEWYGEVNKYLPQMISPFTVGESGHYTAMLWATTWLVGCGGISSDAGRILICNYGPSGNLISGDMYKEGDACTKCPPNTCCGCNERLKDMNSNNTLFDGLCRNTITSLAMELVSHLPQETRNVKSDAQMTIVDFMALVRKLPMKKMGLHTFQELAKSLSDRILATGSVSSRIDIIFDVYQKSSIKQMERAQRSPSEEITIPIRSDNQKLPV